MLYGKKKIGATNALQGHTFSIIVIFIAFNLLQKYTRTRMSIQLNQKKRTLINRDRPQELIFH